VLLTGETGVGKEVLADYIQANSKRNRAPYVKVNCTALSESLIESELFGHEQGAFTGAARRHIGRFERANRGTLFLDEIAELSPAMQTKLLRVLQNREIERVGGSEVIKLDFRLICATHRNLQQSVAEGKFRQDLFYRINIVPLHIPPLRERKDEIAELANRFLARARANLGRGSATLDPETIQLLQSFPWPGNIRELENCIERAALLARDSVLRPSDFWWLPVGEATPLPTVPPPPMVGPPTGLVPVQPVPNASGGTSLPEMPGLSPLENAERVALRQTLDQHRWNFTQAATALNISRSTLYLKARKYNLLREN